MVITYHGAEFFKITSGETTFAFNPISKDSKQKATRFGADVALISLNHPDMNGEDQVTHGEREPFVIFGPGEYEVKKAVIKGFASKSEYSGEERLNTIYVMTLEGMTLCFLGALGSKDIPKDVLQALEETDILFVPIGGEGVLTPSEAHEVAVKLEPRIVIPMHYGTMGVKDALKTFLREVGAENAKPEEKLTLKKKDIEEKEGEVVVLSN